MALVDLTKSQCVCTNCHRQIRKFEQAYLYFNKTVCQQCYGTLQPPAVSSRPVVRHRRYENRLAPLQWTMFGMFVLFSFVGVVTAINDNPSGFVAAWVFCIGWIVSLVIGEVMKANRRR